MKDAPLPGISPLCKTSNSADASCGVPPERYSRRSGCGCWLPGFGNRSGALRFHGLKRWPGKAGMARSLTIVLLAGLLAGCQSSRHDLENAARLTGGDPLAGRTKITQYGCQSCHTIPGVTAARSMVGPPL